MKFSRLVLSVLLFATIAGSSATFGETLIVVRHGDRDRNSPNDPLLPTGENRSRWIGRLLVSLQIDHIYYARNTDEKESSWLRVRQTALGIQAGLLDAADKSAPKPQCVLDSTDSYHCLFGGDGHKQIVLPADHVDIVVMHHENIPPLVNQLIGSDQVKAIGRDDYDDIFILTRQGETEKFTLTRLEFRPPAPLHQTDTQPAPGDDGPPCN